ncbi:hypothetical protein [Streptomyces orinoci]|uniref:Integral membrane protein n=2 Tax=Streptomyces orinoci TaxID=67339 RepID=A0ABV3JX33_STRON
MNRRARAVVAVAGTLPSLLLALCLRPYGALFTVPIALACYAVFVYLQLPADRRGRQRPSAGG